jgi:hypothetical protein
MMRILALSAALVLCLSTAGSGFAQKAASGMIWQVRDPLEPARQLVGFQYRPQQRYKKNSNKCDRAHTPLLASRLSS